MTMLDFPRRNGYNNGVSFDMRTCNISRAEQLTRKFQKGISGFGERVGADDPCPNGFQRQRMPITIGGNPSIYCHDKKLWQVGNKIRHQYAVEPT